MSGFGNFINTLGNIGGALSPFAGIASAIGGLLSGSSSKKEQEAINERNIAFQQEENAKNRAFALSQLGWQAYYNDRAADIAWRRQMEMYERQYQDNSMKAMMQQAKEAGVNPFALFDTQGFQGASVSGIPQANGVSSALVNGVAPHAEMIESASTSGIRNFQAIANALSMLSQSDLNKAQKQSVMAMMQPQVDKLLAETENVELKNTYQSLINSYEAYFGFTEREKKLQFLDGQISNLLQDTLLKGQEVSLKDWENRMNDIKEQILRNEDELGKKKVLQAVKYLQYIDQDYRTTFALRQAQSQQAQAGAAESFAKAETENAMRPFLVRTQNALARLNENEAALKDQSFSAELSMIFDEMQRSGIRTEQLQQALKKAIKENNIYYVKEILGMIRDVGEMGSDMYNAKNGRTRVYDAREIHYHRD